MSPDVAEHRLAAILHADVVGYCRLMSQNEAATIRALRADLEDIARVVRELGLPEEAVARSRELAQQRMMGGERESGE